MTSSDDYNEIEEDYNTDEDDYEINDSDRGLLNSYNSGPFLRLANAIGLPILAAIAATLLISIPNLESIPLVGYFKKTIAFISVVTYLVVIILVVIMYNSENTYFQLSNNTQVIIVLAICASAFIFNFLFELDKPEKSKEELILSIANAYSNGMADYVGKNMGYDKTEKYFSDLLNKISARIMKLPDSVLTFTEKDEIVDVAESATDSSFVKVHKVLNKLYTYSDLEDLESKKNQLVFTTEQEEKAAELETAFYTFNNDVWNKQPSIKETLLVKNPLEHEAIEKTVNYIKNIETYIESFTDTTRKLLPLYEEAHRKLVLLICENKIVNWDNLAADDSYSSNLGTPVTYTEENEIIDDQSVSGLYKARIDLKCDTVYLAAKAAASVSEPFTQSLIIKENESIQDMIDKGKIH